MLQTRNGKRTGAAALRIATAMAEEGAVTRDEAILMVETRHLAQVSSAAALRCQSKQKTSWKPTNQPITHRQLPK